jgi:hypothetical protein
MGGDTRLPTFRLGENGQCLIFANVTSGQKVLLCLSSSGFVLNFVVSNCLEDSRLRLLELHCN